MCLSSLAFGEQINGITAVRVPLRVETGTPLRLYITKRVSYRLGAPVEAKFAEPVWAFDRIVIPAGTTVRGEVTNLEPAPRMIRAMAMVRGDFTPLKRAQVNFTTIILPSGQPMHLATQSSEGLKIMYVAPGTVKKSKNEKAPENPNAKRTKLRNFIKQQAHAQANARSHGLLDLVRGRNRREWLEDFLWSKLPYHPQYYRSCTRFDAVLEQPLDFGYTKVSGKDLQALGTQPAPDTLAAVRLVSTTSSADAHLGDPVEGLLSQPLFSSGHLLVLPEGTRLTGKVTLVRPARMFHRGGQLRFAFNDVEVPAGILASAPQRPLAQVQPESVQAQLTAAEQDPSALKVDREGTAKATESKTRFLRPAIAGLVAAKSLDNDAGKQNATAGANANYSGRTLGGFSGFGLLGAAVAKAPKPVGAALGFYGLAWSVYTNVVSRGAEVTFEKNAAIAIRFGARARAR